MSQDEPTKDNAKEIESIKKEIEDVKTQVAKADCNQSPTGDHDLFFNERTEDTYCRYCGVSG